MKTKTYQNYMDKKNKINVKEVWEEEFQKMMTNLFDDPSYPNHRIVISNFIRQVARQAKEEEQNRILKEIWKRIEWNHKKENQWDGLVNANTRINTLEMIMDIVENQQINFLQAISRLKNNQK